MYTTALMWICVNPYAIIDKIYCCSVLAGSVNFLRDITNGMAHTHTRERKKGQFFVGRFAYFGCCLRFPQLFAKHKSQNLLSSPPLLSAIKPSTVLTVKSQQKTQASVATVIESIPLYRLKDKRFCLRTFYCVNVCERYFPFLKVVDDIFKIYDLQRCV